MICLENGISYDVNRSDTMEMRVLDSLILKESVNWTIASLKAGIRTELSSPETCFVKRLVRTTRFIFASTFFLALIFDFSAYQNSITAIVEAIILETLNLAILHLSIRSCKF